MKSDRRDCILAKIAQRLRADPSTGCHLWTGQTSGKSCKGKSGRGYPRMTLDGETVAVHRVVFAHYYGYIPGKKQVDHTCRNRLCCNPLHLELVTHKQNQKRRDAAKSRRTESGAKPRRRSRGRLAQKSCLQPRAALLGGLAAPSRSEAEPSGVSPIQRRHADAAPMGSVAVPVERHWSGIAIVE